MKIRTAVILICCLFAGTTTINATDYFPELEYIWPHYNKPFHQAVKIPLYGTTSVKVNIGQSFLTDNSTVVLKMVVDTPFRASGDPGISSGFRFLDPYVSVNGKKVFGVYRFKFTVKGDQNRYTAYVKMKTKHLNSGMNTLSFCAGTQDGVSYHCGGGTNCVAVYVFEMMFDTESNY